MPYRFAIDRARGTIIAGWAYRTDRPAEPLRLALHRGGAAVARASTEIARPDLVSLDRADLMIGFEMALPPSVAGAGHYELDLVDEDAGETIATVRFVDTAAMLFRTANLLRRKVSVLLQSDATPARDAALAAARTEARAIGRAFAAMAAGAAARRALVVPSPLRSFSDIIDIIIPVYAGFDETVACIRSVLAARNGTRLAVTVIDDCTPDPAIASFLRELPAGERLQVLRNERNCGFVGSVNRGMALNPDRHVVLLNADAEVSDGWLDHLLAAARSGDDIATATPFTNHGGICAFPSIGEDWRLDQPGALPLLAEAVAGANGDATVDLPVGVGFCLFVNRAALDEVGLFDARKWGRGYGEEVDFCLRAAMAGWRHVLAAGAFVAHVGGVSFRRGMSALRDRNNRKISRLFPFYDEWVTDYFTRDPYKRFRLRALLQFALAQSGRRGLMLDIVAERIDLDRLRCADRLAVTIEPRADRPALLTCLVPAPLHPLLGRKQIEFALHNEEFSWLVADLAPLPCKTIRLHGVFGPPDWIGELYFTVADFRVIDLPRAGAQIPDRFLAHADLVTVPTEAAGRRIRARAPNATIAVSPRRRGNRRGQG